MSVCFYCGKEGNLVAIGCEQAHLTCVPCPSKNCQCDKKVKDEPETTDEQIYETFNQTKQISRDIVALAQQWEEDMCYSLSGNLWVTGSSPKKIPKGFWMEHRNCIRSCEHGGDCLLIDHQNPIQRREDISRYATISHLTVDHHTQRKPVTMHKHNVHNIYGRTGAGIVDVISLTPSSRPAVHLLFGPILTHELMDQAIEAVKLHGQSERNDGILNTCFNLLCQESIVVHQNDSYVQNE